MGIPEYLCLILVCGTGAFVQRVTGFGMGIIAMLFLPGLFQSHTVPAAIMSILSGTTNLFHSIEGRKHIRWRAMIPPFCAALITIPLSISLAVYLPQAAMKRLLGVVLALLSLYFLFASKKIHLKPTIANGLLTGSISGVLTGLFTSGGPPMVLYFVHAIPEKLAYFATIQTFFCLNNIYATGNRILNGLITREVLVYTALAGIGVFLGDKVGGKVFHKLDADRLRKVIYLAMLLSGILMLF